MGGFLKIRIGNVQVVGNLVLRQLANGSGLGVGVVGLDQGLDAGIFQNLRFLLQLFGREGGKNQPVGQWIQGIHRAVLLRKIDKFLFSC